MNYLSNYASLELLNKKFLQTYIANNFVCEEVLPTFFLSDCCQVNKKCHVHFKCLLLTKVRLLSGQDQRCLADILIYLDHYLFFKFAFFIFFVCLKMYIAKPQNSV